MEGAGIAEAWEVTAVRLVAGCCCQVADANAPDACNGIGMRRGRGSEMTNLLAMVLVTVLTTTNDIPRWTSQTLQDGNATWIMYVDEASEGLPVYDWKTGKTNSFIRIPTGMAGDVTERVRVVQTKVITRLTFDWNGKPREVADEDLVMETRTVLVRHETWTPRISDLSPERKGE
jgi:hypothetical protein